MAEFLSTSGISHHLERIIKQAEVGIVLVTPYIKIHQRLQHLLTEKAKQGVSIQIIYGKKRELPEAQLTWLFSHKKISLRYCDSLHAKCYLNENEAIITSMNLYDFSQINNREMGVLIKKQDEPAVYQSIYAESELIFKNSEIRKAPKTSMFDRFSKKKSPSIVPTSKPPIKPKVAEKKASYQAPTPSSKAKDSFCIRCHTEIATNPQSPYCLTCYRSWNRYKKLNYKEKNCHLCGCEHETSMEKPVCLSCYRTNKALFVTT